MPLSVETMCLDQFHSQLHIVQTIEIEDLK